MSQDGQAREIDQAVETIKESDLVGISSAGQKSAKVAEVG